jgi:hypothetical protein
MDALQEKLNPRLGNPKRKRSEGRRLATIPVAGDLLHEIIQPRARIILLGGLGHGKEDLSQQRSGKPSYLWFIRFMRTSLSFTYQLFNGGQSSELRITYGKRLTPGITWTKIRKAFVIRVNALLGQAWQ